MPYIALCRPIWRSSSHLFGPYDRRRSARCSAGIITFLHDKSVKVLQRRAYSIGLWTSPNPLQYINQSVDTENEPERTSNSESLHANGEQSLSSSNETSQSSKHELFHRHRRKSLSAALSPSGDLIAALKDGQHAHALPYEPEGKVDLSFADPLQIHRQAIREHPINSIARVTPNARTATDGARLSLPSTLAKYIRYIHPAIEKTFMGQGMEEISERELLMVYDNATLQYLAQRGFSPTDVVAWAWIITAPTSAQVCYRLISASFEAGLEPVPTFVLMFVLRRQHLNPEAIKLLLLHAWDRAMLPNPTNRVSREARTMLENKMKRKYVEPRRYEDLDSTTFIIMIVRFIRHARQAWPPGLPSIASMAARFFADGKRGKLRRKNGSIHPRLMFFFNRALSLLSMPSSVAPFASMIHHQKAQFILLQVMAEMKPPLLVTKEAYRAITRVQLAQKKTVAEREWGNYKAKSWPPWKEEKLGIDAERGDEGKYSRAYEAMLRMQEAGYSHDSYEEVASIFAGWDTDNSPTIQTRSILPPPMSRLPKRRATATALAWAARILATRTLNEAWACFLACQDAGFSRYMRVYHAMSEKLAYAGRPPSFETTAVAGDGKEVFPEPISPREHTYVRSPAPELHTLLTRMGTEGIKPSGKFLAFLLRSADSLEAGFEHLRSSPLEKSLVAVLTDSHQLARHGSSVNVMPDYLFASFINLLCRHAKPLDFQVVFSHYGLPYVPMQWRAHTNQALSQRGAAYNQAIANPLVHAMEILRHRDRKSSLPWFHILEAFSRVAKGALTHDREDLALSVWIAMLDLLEHMRERDIDLDFHMFNIVCTALERTISSGGGFPKYDTFEKSSPAFGEIERIVFNGVRYAKSMFTRLVSTNYPPFALTTAEDQPEDVNESMIPEIQETPHPSDLHKFIRLLGQAGNLKGVLSLLRWMHRFQRELQAKANEYANGTRLMRTSLVEIRIQLERNCEPMEALNEGSEEALALLDEAYSIIQDLDVWGGWPTDDELEEHALRAQFRG